MPIDNFEPLLIILLAAVLVLWVGRDKKPKPITGSAEYRIYTKEFDREVSGDSLNFPASKEQDDNWQEQVAEYKTKLAMWKASADWSVIGGQTSFSDNTVGCILIDHSGSLRGNGAQLACGCTELIANVWSDAGIPFEILGFTTSSWKGGKSRAKWRRLGAAAAPGRLCDLLHIVYRSLDDTYDGAPESLRNMLHDGLLKENIDGEALDWAVSRLAEYTEKNKVIVVISDGAPVDDSTLHCNRARILEGHLLDVVKKTADDQTFKLNAIGINHSVERYYGTNSGQCLKMLSMGESVEDVINFARQSLTPAEAKPRP